MQGWLIRIKSNPIAAQIGKSIPLQEKANLFDESQW
jgi:hypothetical protein